MGLITPTLPTDGTTADASDISTPINQLANEFNGNIDDANIKSGAAIAGSKLADAGVTGAKLGTWDGYIAGSGTWTYASATTMTVPAADAAVMSVGTKLKLTQTTAKYFYVVGISGTTITFTGGTDYTLANAAITSPYYSNSASPAGFPASFAYTPTLTGFSANPTNIVARFYIVGRQVYLNIATNNGTSNATGFTFTLPVTAATVSNQFWKVRAYTVDNGTAGTGVDFAQIASAGTTVIMQHNDNNSGWTSSGSKGAIFQIFYEI